jgi:DNA-directed RNA polymerase subunit beta'
MENDLAELEDEGAKADQRRKVREAGERELKNIRERAQKELDRLEEVWTRFKNLKVQDLEGDENLYREMRDRYGIYFKGYMGATAIQKRLETFDLKAEFSKLNELAETGKGQKKTRAIKRLKVVNSFLSTSNNPASMVLDCVPVIPPDLRPMVQLDGGRFATSDLNDLYRRVINRNNRLKRLVDLGAPEIISSITVVVVVQLLAQETVRLSHSPTCLRVSRVASVRTCSESALITLVVRSSLLVHNLSCTSAVCQSRWRLNSSSHSL